jgi:hypothetical protein
MTSVDGRLAPAGLFVDVRVTMDVPGTAVIPMPAGHQLP